MKHYRDESIIFLILLFVTVPLETQRSRQTNSGRGALHIPSSPAEWNRNVLSPNDLRHFGENQLLQARLPLDLSRNRNGLGRSQNSVFEPRSSVSIPRGNNAMLGTSTMRANNGRRVSGTSRNNNGQTVSSITRSNNVSPSSSLIRGSVRSRITSPAEITSTDVALESLRLQSNNINNLDRDTLMNLQTTFQYILRTGQLPRGVAIRMNNGRPILVKIDPRSQAQNPLSRVQVLQVLRSVTRSLKKISATPPSDTQTSVLNDEPNRNTNQQLLATQQETRPETVLETSLNKNPSNTLFQASALQENILWTENKTPFIPVNKNVTRGDMFYAVDHQITSNIQNNLENQMFAHARTVNPTDNVHQGKKPLNAVSGNQNPQIVLLEQKLAREKALLTELKIREDRVKFNLNALGEPIDDSKSTTDKLISDIEALKEILYQMDASYSVQNGSQNVLNRSQAQTDSFRNKVLPQNVQSPHLLPEVIAVQSVPDNNVLPTSFVPNVATVNSWQMTTTANYAIDNTLAWNKQDSSMTPKQQWEPVMTSPVDASNINSLSTNPHQNSGNTLIVNQNHDTSAQTHLLTQSQGLVTSVIGSSGLVNDVNRNELVNNMNPNGLIHNMITNDHSQVGTSHLNQNHGISTPTQIALQPAVQSVMDTSMLLSNMNTNGLIQNMNTNGLIQNMNTNDHSQVGTSHLNQNFGISTPTQLASQPAVQSVMDTSMLLNNMNTNHHLGNVFPGNSLTDHNNIQRMQMLHLQQPSPFMHNHFGPFGRLSSEFMQEMMFGDTTDPPDPKTTSAPVTTPKSLTAATPTPNLTTMATTKSLPVDVQYHQNVNTADALNQILSSLKNSGNKEGFKLLFRLPGSNSSIPIEFVPQANSESKPPPIVPSVVKDSLKSFAADNIKSSGSQQRIFATEINDTSPKANVVHREIANLNKNVILQNSIQSKQDLGSAKEPSITAPVVTQPVKSTANVDTPQHSKPVMEAAQIQNIKVDQTMTVHQVPNPYQVMSNSRHSDHISQFSLSSQDARSPTQYTGSNQLETTNEKHVLNQQNKSQVIPNDGPILENFSSYQQHDIAKEQFLQGKHQKQQQQQQQFKPADTHLPHILLSSVPNVHTLQQSIKPEPVQQKASFSFPQSQPYVKLVGNQQIQSTTPVYTISLSPSSTFSQTKQQFTTLSVITNSSLNPKINNSETNLITDRLKRIENMMNQLIMTPVTTTPRMAPDEIEPEELPITTTIKTTTVQKPQETSVNPHVNSNQNQNHSVHTNGNHQTFIPEQHHGGFTVDTNNIMTQQQPTQHRDQGHAQECHPQLPSFGCEGIGMFQTMHSIDAWCVGKCVQGHCVESVCQCGCYINSKITNRVHEIGNEIASVISGQGVQSTNTNKALTDLYAALNTEVSGHGYAVSLVEKSSVTYTSTTPAPSDMKSLLNSIERMIEAKLSGNSNKALAKQNVQDSAFASDAFDPRKPVVSRSADNGNRIHDNGRPPEWFHADKRNDSPHHQNTKQWDNPPSQWNSQNQAWEHYSGNSNSFDRRRTENWQNDANTERWRGSDSHWNSQSGSSHQNSWRQRDSATLPLNNWGNERNWHKGLQTPPSWHHSRPHEGNGWGETTTQRSWSFQGRGHWRNNSPPQQGKDQASKSGGEAAETEQ